MAEIDVYMFTNMFTNMHNSLLIIE